MFNNKVYHKIDALSGSVATLRAEGVRYGEVAEVQSRAGTSLAQVIKLDGPNVTLQVFAGARGVDTSASVRFLGETMKVPFSEDLLGRAFTGACAPRDGGPAVEGVQSPIGQPSVNPARRVMPHEMVRTNIPMIDMFNSLVKSQKLPIFAKAGEPYNDLLARIALQANSDIIIIGGMGLKYDEYLRLRNTLDASGALAKTVMFVHTAADPTVECTLVPDVSLAVAEKFALAGKDVLVLLTDMTSFADAMKEIAITMEQIPSNRGYPGDLYSQLAARYEKAVDFDGAGSITILAVTTMPGDDVTHPVPDNTGYITEGQFYLRGGRIEPFGSLSRLKQQVNKGVDPCNADQRSYLMSKVLDGASEGIDDKELLRRANTTRYDHRALMDAMIKLYAQYKETVEKQSMGFRMSAWDRKLLGYGAEFEEKMMDLSVNIELIDALDLGWRILADNFDRSEVGIPSKLTDRFWPAGGAGARPAAD
ncbi:MAG: V-type ATP synthase subunit B [Kiritimatiellae bacterium]|nr:V-type ATP synthase subunit B [Kiritimatiellia bacterium]